MADEAEVEEVEEEWDEVLIDMPGLLSSRPSS